MTLRFCFTAFNRRIGDSIASNDDFRESTIDLTGDAGTDGDNSDGDGGVDSDPSNLEHLFSQTKAMRRMVMSTPDQKPTTPERLVYNGSLRLLEVDSPSEDTPEIHVELRKAERSILTQIRTGWIGLASFHNRARVPDFSSPICQCGQAEETAAHIIVYCPRFVEQRRSLANPLTGRQDVQALVSSAEGAKRGS